MNNLSILLVIIGLIFLLLAIAPAHKISCYRTGQALGWRVIYALILLFILGYSFFLHHLIFEPAGFVDTILSIILSSGGIFVFLVLRMSLSSIISLDTIAFEHEEQSLHDILTGLPNRKSLFITLDNTIDAQGRSEDAFAVMVMDLNGFKAVNDTLGHHVGDLALQLISPRLKREIRSTDSLCRMGGDEFAVVLPQTDLEQAIVVAQKMIVACEESLMVEGHEVLLGISIGIAVYPQHGDTANRLIQVADVAMYHAKRSGSGVEVYRESYAQDFLLELSKPHQLQQAVVNNELVLYYQPILIASKLVGLEALLYWPTDAGILPAKDFMPLAERLGLSQKITSQIIDQALSKFSYWQKSYSFQLHFNIFIKDMASNEFIDSLQSELIKFSVPASRITLEMSEGLLHSCSKEIHHSLKQLDALGLTLAIDDFGNSGAGFMLLRDYPIKEIKLDRFFAKNFENEISSQGIVQAANMFCHHLDLSLIVDGVSTQAALDCLNTLGIDSYQGAALCPPLTAEEMDLWLADHYTECK